MLPDPFYRVGVLFFWGAFIGALLCSPSKASLLHRAQPIPSVDTGRTATTVVQKYLIMGTTESQLDDHKEAILYYETALDRAPNEPVLLQALADAHEANGDLATALFYARQARTHGNDRPYYYHRHAELQKEAGDPQAALKTYQSAVSRFPESGATYRALASLQTKLDRPEAALTTYTTLLKRKNRPTVSVYREMLALYRRTGDAEGIEKTLRVLVQRRPNNRRYRRRLGEHYAENDRSREALDLLAPLAQHHPDDTALQQQVQRLSQKSGRASSSGSTGASSTSLEPEALSADQLVRKARSAYDEALPSTAAPDSTRLRRAEKLLDHALDRAPSNVEALSLRARIHRKKGQPQMAGKVLKRSLEKNPREANRWVRAASAYLEANASQQALSVSEEGLLLFPGHAPLARIAGFAQLKSGNPGRAVDRFQEALTLLNDTASSSTKTATLHAGLGRAYTQLDRPAEADEAFQTAQSFAPEHPFVLRSHAYILALRGTDLDRALKLARRAADQSPTDPQTLGTLGWVHFQRDNLDAARRHLQNALEGAPPSARLLEQYGDVQHALGNDSAARTYWKQALKHDPDRSSLRNKLEEVPSSHP